MKKKETNRDLACKHGKGKTIHADEWFHLEVDCDSGFVDWLVSMVVAPFLIDSMLIT